MVPTAAASIYGLFYFTWLKNKEIMKSKLSNNCLNISNSLKNKKCFTN